MNRNKNWKLYSPSTLITCQEEQEIIRLILEHYHRTLFKNRDAMAYLLNERGLKKEDAKSFALGYVDRSFPKKMLNLPNSEREKITGVMMRFGLKNPEGFQTFWGMIICPVCDESGKLTGAFGQRVKESRDKPMTASMSLEPGVFYTGSNPAIETETILCDSPFDVMALNLIGINNVVSAPGECGLDEYHIQKLCHAGVKRVTIGYNRSQSGDGCRTIHRKKLELAGIAVDYVDMQYGLSFSQIFANSVWLNRYKEQVSA